MWNPLNDFSDKLQTASDNLKKVGIAVENVEKMNGVLKELDRDTKEAVSLGKDMKILIQDTNELLRKLFKELKG